MTTETLRGKTIRLAKEATGLQTPSLSNITSSWVTVETLVRLAQQEALEDAAKEFEKRGLYGWELLQTWAEELK